MLNDKKDRVIYDGVFSRQVEIPKCLKKAKRFLFVGALNKGKGIYDALAAFDSIAGNNPEYEFWIAGDDYVDIKKSIAKCKHFNQIKYLGFRSDIYQLMAESTALLVPSFYEGFGFITAEAMLNKTLVIGRNVAGTKEQFDNGCNMFNKPIALSFTDMESFKEHLQTVCDKGASAFNDYTDRAYNTVKKLYTIEDNCLSLLKFYNHILN